MRFLTGVLITVFFAPVVSAQYVPPVLKGLRGETAVGNNPIPIPGRDQTWIRAVSPNFTVISSAPAARTREITELLETVGGALRHVHPRFDARFTDTKVFIFGRRRDSQAYFDVLLNRRDISASGAFVSQSDGSSVMVVDAGRTWITNRTVKHELMHNILSASGTRLPLWLEEGIAEYFSTVEVRDNRVVVGRPIVGHQLQIRSRGVLPMETVMNAKTGSPVTTHVLFYPQVWAMVDWMMRAGRDRFYGFVSAVDRGVEVPAAFRSHFGLEPSAVARSFRAFVVRPSASNALQIEKAPVDVAIREISAADALSELASFLGGIEATRDDAEAYLRAAMELEGDHARARAELAMLRVYDRKRDEATALFEEALRLDPHDPAVKLAYATALLGRALGPFAGAFEITEDAVPRFHRARELALEAHAKEPSALADAIIGSAYLVDDDVTDAVPHLERARAARPARLDFALNLYAVYLRLRLDDKAEALFGNVFERSRNPQAAYAARAVRVREALREANGLIRQERLHEAADVVHRMAAVTTDPLTRAELLKQAEDLCRVAGANREIVEFNRAVAAYNQREIGEALHILDSLLATATDTDVRMRAERLRTTVRRRLGGM